MAALGREADFLHSTVDRYIEDAQNDNNSKLVQVWNNKQKHLDMLKRCLEKDVQQGELNQ
jgi:hypothetical protein